MATNPDLKWFYQHPVRTIDLVEGDWGGDTLLSAYRSVLGTAPNIDWDNFAVVGFFDSRLHASRRSALVTNYTVTSTASVNSVSLTCRSPFSWQPLMVVMGVENAHSLDQLQGTIADAMTATPNDAWAQVTGDGYYYFAFSAAAGQSIASCSFISNLSGIPHHFVLFLRPITNRERAWYRQVSPIVSRFKERGYPDRIDFPYALVSEWEHVQDCLAGEDVIFWGRHEPFLAAYETNALSPRLQYGLQLRGRRNAVQKIDLKGMTIEVRPVATYQGAYPEGGFPLITELGPEWQIVNAQIQPLNGNATRFYQVNLATRRVRVFHVSGGVFAEVATGQNVTGETVYQILTAIPATTGAF